MKVNSMTGWVFLHCNQISLYWNVGVGGGRSIRSQGNKGVVDLK